MVGSVRCPDVEREEIVNACGVDDFHDGANVIRTACVVGMAKARSVLEPFIQQLGYRLTHILRRMLPVSMYLQQKDGAPSRLPASVVSACLCAHASVLSVCQCSLCMPVFSLHASFLSAHCHGLRLESTSAGCVHESTSAVAMRADGCPLPS